MSGRYDFILKQGSTYIFEATWKTNGKPVDLYEYTARMHVRSGNHKGIILFELSTETGDITLEELTGIIRIVIPATKSDKANVDTCVYDLEVQKGDYVERILEGKIRISPSVTRISARGSEHG